MSPSCPPRSARLLSFGSVVLLLAAALPALADSPDPLEERHSEDSWVPSIGFFVPVNIHKIEAGVVSNTRGAVNGEDLNTHMRLQGEIEVSSPRLLSGMGEPRLFFRVGAGRSFDTRHNTAKEGDPGPAIIPTIPGGLQPPLESVTGQGSATRVFFNAYSYTASVGFSFSFPLGEHEMRLKPSVEYRHGSTEIEGLVTSAISIAGDGVCPCSVGRITSTEQEDYDGLGAGLELEFDTARAGDFMISLFTAGQAYKTMNGRKLSTGATSTFDDGITPIDLQSRVILDEWSFSWGVGMRFRWLPE